MEQADKRSESDYNQGEVGPGKNLQNLHAEPDKIAESMAWIKMWKRRITQLKARRLHRGGWSRAKMIRNLSVAVLIMVVSGTLLTALLFAWYARSLPQPDKVVRREGFSTKIFDRNKELLYEVYADQRRTPATLEQIPVYLKEATVAIEDKNFYVHGGFDPQGYLRIIWNVITKRRLIGGSTLT